MYSNMTHLRPEDTLNWDSCESTKDYWKNWKLIENLIRSNWDPTETQLRPNWGPTEAQLSLNCREIQQIPNRYPTVTQQSPNRDPTETQQKTQQKTQQRPNRDPTKGLTETNQRPNWDPIENIMMKISELSASESLNLSMEIILLFWIKYLFVPCFRRYFLDTFHTFRILI